MIEHLLPHPVGFSVDQVQHTARHACVHQHARESHCRQRRELRRPTDNGTSSGERRGPCPRGIVGGEVPRRDDTDDAEGLLQDREALAGDARRDGPSVRALAFFGKPVEQIRGDKPLAARLREWLSALEHHHARDVVSHAAHRCCAPLQDGAPFVGRTTRPVRERSRRCFNCATAVVARAKRHGADHFLRRRIDDVPRCP